MARPPAVTFRAKRPRAWKCSSRAASSSVATTEQQTSLPASRARHEESLPEGHRSSLAHPRTRRHPVRVAPPEDLIWHRLFVSERHRWDMSDIAHLILCRGDELNWERLLARVGDYWRLLLAQVLTFDFVYPGHRHRIPTWVREDLLDRTHEELQTTGDPGACWGTMISRFSFAIDVNEWGFDDPRAHSIEDARATEVVQRIIRSDVWQERKSSHAA